MKVREKTRSQIPLIVRPIYEKGTQFRQRMGPLWRRAREVFENAEKLIVFGYSFPDADFAASSLMTRAFYRNSDLTEVTVINPDPAATARISALLHAECTHHYATVPLVAEALARTGL